MFGFFSWLRAEVAAAVRGGFQDALAAPLTDDGPSPPAIQAVAEALPQLTAERPEPAKIESNGHGRKRQVARG